MYISLFVYRGRYSRIYLNNYCEIDIKLYNGVHYNSNINHPIQIGTQKNLSFPGKKIINFKKL